MEFCFIFLKSINVNFFTPALANKIAIFEPTLPTPNITTELLNNISCVNNPSLVGDKSSKKAICLLYLSSSKISFFSIINPLSNKKTKNFLTVSVSRFSSFIISITVFIPSSEAKN